MNAQNVIDDRFFDSEVYIQLSNQDYVDGILVGQPDIKVTRKYVAKLAAEKFEAQAAGLGIPNGDITKAMFEGRFNPYFEDFKLVYESFGSHDDIRDADIPADYFDRHDGKRPADIFLNGILGSMRNQAFNERYGSLNDKGFQVNTIVHGKTTVLSGSDLAFRQLVRLDGYLFEQAYGIKVKPEMTYQDAVIALGDKQDAIETLEKEVESTMKRQCAFSHFNLYVKGEDKKYDLQEDYQSLRRNRYLPSLYAIKSEPVTEKLDVKEEIIDTVSPQTFPVILFENEQSAIEWVRYTLKTDISDTISINGEWNESIARLVGLEIYIFQGHEIFGEGWTGPVNGIYTDEFAAFFKSKLVELDDGSNEIYEFMKFAVALDYLKDCGIYSEPMIDIVEDEGDLDNHITFNSFGTFILGEFLKGFLYDWGDNLWCYLIYGKQGYNDCVTEFRNADYVRDYSVGAILGLLIYFLGVELSPFGLGAVIILQIQKRRKKNKIKWVRAFKIGFFVEVVEGFVSMLGEIATYGYVEGVGIFLLTIIAASILTGWAAAFGSPK